MELCEHNKCTVCGACIAFCTHGAICFEADSLGKGVIHTSINLYVLSVGFTQRSAHQLTM